jgi:coenzyme F420-reducing hydrogenase delta subunit
MLFQNLLEHMGVEPDRIHFSWISSAESTKFVKVVKEVTEKVKALGPNKHFVKYKAKVA